LRIEQEFVKFIPDELAEGTFYISVEFATCVHRCLCGCGNKVVTPLTPTDWTLIFDGETVSLDPSIGNWSFDCRSHYWIERNRVHWAGGWSQAKVDAGRRRDSRRKRLHFGEDDGAGIEDAGQAQLSRLRRLLKRIGL
jgi:hypothetical protein